MKIEPLRRYATPQLPTREIVDEHPELLRLLPKRWQTNPAVVAALAACIAMSTCAAEAATKPAAKAKAKPKPTPKITSRIAPIFTHGSGIGSFGCEVVNPPTFLSEAEARQVIIEEAKRAGIIFTADSKILPKVDLPTTTREWGDKPPKRQLKGWPVGLDGTDKKRNISFEYVSREDTVKWQGDPSDHPVSTVISYDVSGAAKDLQAGIAKAKPVGTYAVFYDPVALQKMSFGPSTDYDAAMGNAMMAAMDEARENLRAQVKDFIKWLKGQGVI